MTWREASDPIPAAITGLYDFCLHLISKAVAETERSDTRAATLSLRLEATAGDSDEQIATAMVAYANHFAISIVVDFNGHDMLAWPGEKYEDVLERLWRQTR